MFWTSVKRVVRAGCVGFYRNGFVSLSSVAVMTVTLFTIGGVLFLGATLNASLEELKDKVDINVYFQSHAPESEIQALASSVKALHEVKSVEYISRAVALQNFKKRHENDQLTLQALAELPDNPLGAVLNIRATDPSRYESIAAFLKGETALSKGQHSIIDEVNYYDNKKAIDALTRIITSAKTLGGALTLILVIISFMIAFNTIRLAIYVSREEIGVMRLVGARNAYIRGPFVVSGVLYGVVAAFITLAAFYPLTYYLGGATENFFSGLNLFRYYLAHFAEFFVIIAGAGVGLGAVGRFFATGRYLKI